MGKTLNTNTISSSLFKFVFKARWCWYMTLIQELRRQRQAKKKNNNNNKTKTNEQNKTSLL